MQAQLRAGADIDHKDKNGWTALHHAALGGYRDCVQILLEAGSDINLRTEDLRTPLFIAVYNGKTDAALCLMSTQGVDLQLSLRLAYTPGALEMDPFICFDKEPLTGRNLRTSFLNCTPLSLSIILGNMQMAQSIYNSTQNMATGINWPNSPELWDAGMCAIVFNRPEMLKWLISMQLVKADGGIGEGGYLEAAIATGKHEGPSEICSSLQREVILFRDLYQATKVGYLEVMHELLMGGADVNITCPRTVQSSLLSTTILGADSAPIHVAALFDQADAATLLVKHGCNVATKDDRGRDALILATISGSASVAGVLVDAGAKIDEMDCYGNTALSYTDYGEYPPLPLEEIRNHYRMKLRQGPK